MFSPGIKRSSNRKAAAAAPDSPAPGNNSIPNRPATGTPAPWAPRLSVLARAQLTNKSEKKASDGDPIKPVYVGEFPEVVRDEQASFLRSHIPGDTSISGGMDKETCLSWIICRNRLIIWSHLSSSPSKDCVVLQLPLKCLDDGAHSNSDYHGTNWLLCFLNWDPTSRGRNKAIQSCKSAGVVMCNQKTRAVTYWPDIYNEYGSVPVTCMLASDESEVTSFPVDGKSTPNQLSAINTMGSNSFNSLIACALPDSHHVSVALACSSNGELWHFYCAPTGIQCCKVYQDTLYLSSHGSDESQFVRSKGYPRSLIWRFPPHTVNDSERQFFLLTDREIQCFSIKFHPDLNVSKMWSHEIVGTDSDLGIKKDLAGQKRIWPLDVKVDDHGKVITVLVATFCKDRVSSSSYTQYSLLTMQYKSSVNISSGVHERVLEKKAPIQVIIPKARVEDEDFLFSMRLRIGGKPSGSTLILSGDGTATVSHYFRNSTRLYQFDLPYDAGNVLDASVLPSTNDGEDGAWIVLTEKAGIWAIPEKAVVLGGVEPPERSLSRKGSSNEGSTLEERRNLMFAGNVAPRRASSEAGDAGDRKKAVMNRIARRTSSDEESEALLGQLFHDFLLTGKVDASYEKLQSSGAFERDGETNVFTRASKSIIDTLAKHWTTTRGAEILAMTMVYNQLMDKQEKHQRFLQFLALSKCHEELCTKQRHSMLTIMEHGEKLAGMIQLRELQNAISQNRSNMSGSPHSSSEAQLSGALWDLIQLVGERARCNTVLLMDRDNAEVFYSKVSDLEEVFYCLYSYLAYIINEEQPREAQIQRACELSNAIVSIVRSAMLYRNEHHMWYPLSQGLTSWCCQPVVRNGLWSVASFMLQLLHGTSELELSAKLDLYAHLEVLAEVVLEAYSGAITANVERGGEHKGLLDEYWNRRDSLLDSLYKQVKYFAEGGHQVLNVRTDEPDEEIPRKLTSNLLSISKRHEGYNTMWSICCDINDSALLRNLMHESMGPKGGFSNFVFKQLYEKRQFSKLLRLGEEFQEELSIFLKHHRNLLWLHELFLHHFSSASETLHVLALSQDETVISEAEETTDHVQNRFITTLADRKRFLNLSKIAIMAGKTTDSEMKRIEADLKILKLQEEIMKLLPANEANQYDEQRLLHPEELIELCFRAQNPELALRGFDVFAWTSSSFRRSHRNLLGECWKNAADQDDWGQLLQASKDEGWSDEETLQQLRDTVLFQASSSCYGPNAETIEEGFDAVLPLRKENSEVTGLEDLDFSVEAILMQHKDYPDAGKLMLTAIMFGSVHDSSKVEENPSSME
ncbi:NUCLEAR PORE COMPLEX PROTEIN NUP133 [Salix viminalis]|uniref:NUCLEAR PORE COMPLEX PROTEIN NUP133 n=1 Tax=Salix viminalis TaxID=40686 RepID=A0A9Q0UFN3_SALVM|nr:NUCLEAR PORE COMPLEX PROTEIN NUP133 [Salix viminalis]